MKIPLLIASLIFLPSAGSLQACQGRCGDTNADGDVNVSDVVYIVRYVFTGGPAPVPVKACGDANDDAKVSVSDTVYIINYVFWGGLAPADCSAGDPAWGGNDCCPF